MKTSNNNKEILSLNKRIQIIELYEIYKCLLTQKQIDYFENYYYNDMSLSELAAKYNISKVAVLDSLKKTIKLLEKYEQNLNNNFIKKEILKILQKENEISKIKVKIIELLGNNNYKDYDNGTKIKNN